MIAGWLLNAFKEQLGFWQFACVVLGLAGVQYIINRFFFKPLTQRMVPAHVPNSPITHWMELGQTRSLFRLIVGAMLGAGAIAFFGLAYSWTREPIHFYVGLIPAFSFLVSLFSLSSRWMSYPK